MFSVLEKKVCWVIGFLSFEGRLWIHAASKVPDEATVKAMEEFYKEIYAVDGIYDLKFPENYPVSRLLGIYTFVTLIWLDFSFLFFFMLYLFIFILTYFGNIFKTFHV